MARSKQNGIAPDNGGSLSGKAGPVVEAGGKKTSDGNKSSKNKSKKKRSNHNKKSKKVEDFQDVAVFDEDGEGSISGKVEAAAVNNRDALREEVMTQVRKNG